VIEERDSLFLYEYLHVWQWFLGGVKVDYIAQSWQPLLDDCKQQVFYQGLCNRHVMIRWCDSSLLIITTKRSRGYIDSPFRQVMRSSMRIIKPSKHLVYFNCK
jgi:hypothetical protein